MQHLPFKILFLAGFLHLMTGAYSQGTWEHIIVPTEKNLNSLFFTDSLCGWVAGDSGTIIHTANGGASWSLQESNTANDIVEIFFLNRDTGWASSYNYNVLPYGTLLLTTVDGGQHWSGEFFPSENIFITCIRFSDALNGWVGGKPHALMHTADGGDTWTQAQIDTSILAFFPVLSIRFWNAQYGYACGGMFDIAGVVWNTSDSGKTWRAIDASDAPADEVHELHLFDSVTVLGAGGDPDFGYGVGMIRTFDGGMNWDYEELGVQGNAYDLDFRTAKQAWAPLGPRRKFVYTADGGLTWSAIPTPDSTAIYKVTFPDSLHGFAAGKDGAVLRFNSTGGMSVEPRGADQQLGLSNFPNPFSTETRISFRIPTACLHGTDAGCGTLEVMDVFGNRVKTFELQDLTPGEHTVTFHASDLRSGLYFCRLTIDGSKSQAVRMLTRKMVLMR